MYEYFVKYIIFALTEIIKQLCKQNHFGISAKEILSFPSAFTVAMLLK